MAAATDDAARGDDAAAGNGAVNAEVERLLDLASPLPAGERLEFLDAQCDDPQVRAEVESLLRYADGSETFFENAVAGVARSLHADDPAPGEAFGAYRIVGLIGRGGMGNVYLAERADGEIEQRVAIKLLGSKLPGGDRFRAGLRTRFLIERQLLASLNHPSIVRVIDAGHTPEGRPFLVMEHVEGDSIDVYAARLAMRDRLRLFLQVCYGVSHAHRRLIIHRDLKPSNILVDASGHPKLLDFGIAKLLDEAVQPDGAADRLLTPEYASPEQFAGAAHTTATDIYSLGAVLSKLLTGAVPSTGRLPSIVEDPAPPDIAYVVQKAMRQDPEDRYVSVDELANDIRAALDYRPVKARAGGLWYRTRRFLRRNWLPALAASVAAAGVAGGFYATNRERAIAERHFLETRQLSNKLFDIDRRVAQLPGGSKTREFIVATALDYLQRLSADAGNDPSLALDLGTAYMRVARVQGVNISTNLGETEKADESEAKAQALIESVLAADSRNRRGLLRTGLLRAAQIAHDRMTLAGDERREEDALGYAKKALGYAERYLVAGTLNKKSDREESQQIILVFINTANRFIQANRYDEAIPICKRAAEIAEATNWPAQAGSAWMLIAMAQRAKGELESAGESGRRAIALLTPAASETSSGRLMAYSLALMRQGQILGEDDAISLGRSREAIDYFERSRALADEFARRDPTDFQSQYRVYSSDMRIAPIISHTDPKRALGFYDDALDRMAAVSTNAGTPLNEAAALAASVDPLLRLGRFAAARERVAAALERLGTLAVDRAGKERPVPQLVEALRAQAECEAATRHPEKALKIYIDLIASVGQARTLEEAVNLSSLYRAGEGVAARSGASGEASDFAARRHELWRIWKAKLPGSSYVTAQAAAAGTR
jgi:serine/threonine protein kinase